MKTYKMYKAQRKQGKTWVDIGFIVPTLEMAENHIKDYLERYKQIHITDTKTPEIRIVWRECTDWEEV